MLIIPIYSVWGAFCLLAVQVSSWYTEDWGPLSDPPEEDNEEVKPPTLLPAVHWNHPAANIRNLEPADAHDLYFSTNGISDPGVQHTFASVSMTLNHLAVVLDHSSHIETYSCTSDHVLVTFTSRHAFDYASEHWSAVASKLALVTYADGCHGDTTEQRTFWKVDALGLMNDSLTISATVERELPFEEALQEVELSWGSYSPESSPATNVFARQTTNNTQSCGAAPASTVDGLPAAACGDPNFDKILDDALGYYDWSTDQYANSLKSFFPGFALNSSDLTPNDLQLNSRSLHLEKRGFFDSVSDFGSHVVDDVSSVVSGLIVGAGDLLADGVLGILQIERNAMGTVPLPSTPYGGPTTPPSSYINKLMRTFTFAPKNDSYTVLGPSTTIYQTTPPNVVVSCVNCGVRATVTIEGQVAYSIPRASVSVLRTSLGLDFIAGVNIGIFANLQYTERRSRQLINVPINGLSFSIAKIVNAGFSLGVDAAAEVDVDAAGQAIIGVAVAIPDFKATLDLVNPSQSRVTGSTPQFSRNLQTGGQINTNVKLSLPIALVLGIKVPLINYARSVALVEEPAIVGNVLVSGGTFVNPTCQNGAAYTIGFQNLVSLVINNNANTLSQYNSPPIAQGCFRPGLSSRSDMAELPQLQGRSPTLLARQANTTALGNSTMTAILSEPEALFMHDPTDPSGPNNDPVWNFTTNPNNPQYQALSAQALAAAATATNPSGTTYATVVDMHSQLTLLPGTDGNIYAGNFTLWTSDGSGLFAQNNGVITSDISGRVLHYYPDELAAYNVSRLRLANQTSTPKGSAAVSLAWLDWDPSNSATPNLYLPVDTRTNLYNPVLCNFANGAPSKLFVARGQSGLNSLQSNYNVDFTVTGAPVTGCFPLALVPGMTNS